MLKSEFDYCNEFQIYILALLMRFINHFRCNFYSIMKVCKIIGIILFSCILLRVIVGEPCFIPSSSMEPTLRPGDYGWINKFTYGGRLPSRWADIPLINIFTWIRPLREIDENNQWKYRRLWNVSEPRIGDVVVFNNPENTKMLLVKRIRRIINEGDTLYISSDSIKSFQNSSESERISSLFKDKVCLNEKKDSAYIVNQNLYFVEGDNYYHSKDSRAFGYISERSIVGKFESVLFSIGTTAKGNKQLRIDRLLQNIK